MAASDVSELRQRLDQACRHLTEIVEADHDAYLSRAAEVEINGLIAQAVAALTGDPRIEALSAANANLDAVTPRPDVLARDLLISADLAHRSLL